MSLITRCSVIILAALAGLLTPLAIPPLAAQVDGNIAPDADSITFGRPPDSNTIADVVHLTDELHIETGLDEAGDLRIFLLQGDANDPNQENFGRSVRFDYFDGAIVESVTLHPPFNHRVAHHNTYRVTAERADGTTEIVNVFEDFRNSPRVVNLPVDTYVAVMVEHVSQNATRDMALSELVITGELVPDEGENPDDDEEPTVVLVGPNFTAEPPPEFNDFTSVQTALVIGVSVIVATLIGIRTAFNWGIRALDLWRD